MHKKEKCSQDDSAKQVQAKRKKCLCA